MERQQAQAVWERYRDNPFRQLADLTTHIESIILAGLEQSGFDKLKLSYAAPVSALAGGGLRLTELAARQGISKQLCRQAMLPIIKAGYLQQSADPDDARAKILSLTSRGQSLLQHALTLLQQLERDIADKLGESGRFELATLLSSTYRQRPLEDTGPDRGAALWASAMTGLVCRQLQLQLMTRLKTNGHQHLQPSFSQVLEHIDLQGSSLTALAQRHGVTPQAIYRIASKLESLGYVRRERKGGQTLLLLTSAGLQLLADADDAMTQTLSAMAATMGAQALQTMQRLLAELWRQQGGEARQPAAFDWRQWRLLQQTTKTTVGVTNTHPGSHYRLYAAPFSTEGAKLRFLLMQNGAAFSLHRPAESPIAFTSADDALLTDSAGGVVSQQALLQARSVTQPPADQSGQGEQPQTAFMRTLLCQLLAHALEPPRRYFHAQCASDAADWLKFQYHEALPDALAKSALLRLQQETRSQDEGCNWEDYFQNALDGLNPLLNARPFLGGTQATEADLALFAALSATLGRDPRSSALLKQRAPAVWNWLERNHSQQSPQNDKHQRDKAPRPYNPEHWLPLMRWLANDYLPWLCAKASAGEHEAVAMQYRLSKLAQSEVAATGPLIQNSGLSKALLTLAKI